MAQFGSLESKKDKKDSKKELDLTTLLFLSEQEIADINALAQLIAKERRAPTAEELSALRTKTSAADIAMFGRMIAEKPAHNVEAAVQVANAITVHSADVEDDYFSAVDDLSPDSDTGSAHIGELGFGAGVFYSYLCIDRELLIENLGGDKELAHRAIAALTESAATVAPKGKQATFASRAYAFYGLAELGSKQPRSLAIAFLKPVEGSDVGNEAVSMLREARAGLESVYGKSVEHYEFSALKKTGTLEELTRFGTTSV
jgi:CRISPR system Cascade subunit CasC